MRIKSNQTCLGLFFVAMMSLGSIDARAAGVRVSLLANMLYPWPIVGGGSAVSSTGNIGFGGGGELDVVLSPWFGISAGGHFMQRTLNTVGAMTQQQISIPAQLKLYLGRYFEFGVGGYYAVGLQTFAGYTNSDYGLIGGIGFNIPISPTVAIKLASRYNYALVDIDTSGATVSPNNIQVFAGVTFGTPMMGR